ncbi:MogA/MoaB family molybdenum cofactor biosynthesis protein [Alteribacillus iranensis]|uniref:Molybdenum cofactor biosynthesis protein B n=1 Tax=Alteribacillus iranensis TaxID=930128 RepID=A0A1I2B0X1_9BACI|nr:MogA/MoaB family molybdenum cofactor biosynthesis protein [Alteribacillus iranensis]SFE49699.1 molybdopterin adenylyltransferase [Alteribacillus iranensis]
MHETNEGIRGRIGIITVSDTRTEETDKSGAIIRQLAEEQGHEITAYDIVKDEKEKMQDLLHTWLQDEPVDVVIMNGGTGFSPRDVTYEAVNELLDKEMEGFGELFRMLSYEEIGAKAMFSRAIGGSVKEKVIFALPGSSNAVKLGMNQLILPVLSHFMEELNK